MLLKANRDNIRIPGSISQMIDRADDAGNEAEGHKELIIEPCFRDNQCNKQIQYTCEIIQRNNCSFFIPPVDERGDKKGQDKIR